MPSGFKKLWRPLKKDPETPIQQSAPTSTTQSTPTLVLPENNILMTASSSSLAPVPVSMVHQQSRHSLRGFFTRSNRSSVSLLSTRVQPPGYNDIPQYGPDGKADAMIVANNNVAGVGQSRITPIADTSGNVMPTGLVGEENPPLLQGDFEYSTRVGISSTGAEKLKESGECVAKSPAEGVVGSAGAPPIQLQGTTHKPMASDVIASDHLPSNAAHTTELESATPGPLLEGKVAKVTIVGAALAHNPRAQIDASDSRFEPTAPQEVVIAPLETVELELPCGDQSAASRTNDFHRQPLQRRRTIPNQPATEDRISVVSRRLWETAFTNLEHSDREILNIHVEFLHTPPGNILVIDNLVQSVAQRKTEIDNKRGGMWTFTWGNKKFNMVKLLDKIVEWADRFKAIGDTIVQYDPGHMALPWAAARFLLQLMTEDSANMAAITITIERVTNISTICAIYTGMYLGNRILSTVCYTRLETTLVKLHENILFILARAVRYLKHKRALVQSLFQYENFETQLRKIDDILQELRGDVNIAEGELMNLNRQWQQDTYHHLKSLLHGLGSTMEKLERSAEALENDLQEKKRNDLLTWISSCPYKRHHDDILQGGAIMENTGRWLFETDDFIDWIKKSESSVFWLNGDPGVGKSHLTYAAIQFLQSAHNNPVRIPVVYFYCSRRDNDKARSEPEAIIRALLKGLLMKSGIDPEEISLISRYKERMERGELSLKEAQTFMIKLLKQPQCHGSILFIDALDEVDKTNRPHFMLLVGEIVTSTSTKVWIASRREFDIQRGLVDRIPQKAQRSDLVRDVAIAKRNKGEIRQYIEREVDDRIESGELLDGDVENEMKRVIIEKLTEKGDGMYLWVHLQILSLCSLTHADHVYPQLEKLPHSLDNTYRRIYDEITKTSAPDRANAISVFKWLCATTALKLSELTELVKHTHTAYNVTAPFIDQNYLRKICHNLVVIDDQQQDPEVRLVHLSVREFLESEQDLSQEDLPHEMALKTCLDHLLGESSFSSIMPYTVLNWTRHYRLAIDALDDRPRYSDKVSHIISQTNQFLQRAHMKWLKMLSTIHGGLTDDIDPLFTIARFNLHELCQDAFRSPTLFKIKPENRPTSNETPLHLAVKGGHLKTVESFITIGGDLLDVNAQDQDGRTPLALAIALRKYDLIQLLLRSSQSSLDLNKPDNIGGFPPLVRAAWLGDEQTVQILLNATQARLDSCIRYDCNPITLNLNACDSLGRTAFHWAIFRQNTDIIRLLAKAGADVNACDGVSGKHPLSKWAFDYGTSVLAYAQLSCGLDKAVRKLKISLSSAKRVVELGLDVGRQLFQLPGIDTNARARDGSAVMGQLFYMSSICTDYPTRREFIYAAIKSLLSTKSFDINATIFVARGICPPLTWAVGVGMKGLVELLMNHESLDPTLRLNINTIGSEPFPSTALGHAVSDHRLDIVKLLLTSRFSVDLRLPDINGQTPLQIAFENGSWDMARVLIQAEGLTSEKDLELLMNANWGGLSQAAFDSHDAILQVVKPGYIGGSFQYHSGIDYQAYYQRIRELDDRVWNVYRIALNVANDEMAQQQLLCVDINTTDSTGTPALHLLFTADCSKLITPGSDSMSQWPGHSDEEIKKKILRVLLATPGIDGNIRNNVGDTLLMTAIVMNSSDTGLFQMLLDAEGVVDINFGADTGRSPLVWEDILDLPFAGIFDRWQMYVADKRARLNIYDEDGTVLLAMLARKVRDISLLGALLRTGRVQPNLQSKGTGRSALSEAVAHSNYPAVNMLLKYPGIETNLPDQSLETPLTIAAQIGNVKILKALLRMKPNLAWRNYRGLTAMEIAVEEGYVRVVELLNDALNGEIGSDSEDDSDRGPSDGEIGWDSEDDSDRGRSGGEIGWDSEDDSDRGP